VSYQIEVPERRELRRGVVAAPRLAGPADAGALRILLLNERCHLNPLAGGAETHLFEIFGRLADRGVRTELLCSGFPNALPTGEHRGVAVSRIGTRLSYYARVAGEARRRVGAGDVDLIVEAHNKIPFLAPLYAGRTPVLVIHHHLHAWTAFRQVSPPIAAVALALEKLIPRLYRDVRFLTISASSKRDLIGRGVQEEQIDVVPCGLDHALHRPAPAEGRERLVVSLGRLEPYKRLDLLLAAWPRVLAEVPSAQLAIVGRGQEESRLHALAARLGLLRSVTFAGFVTDAEKVAWLQRAALLVQVSRKEGWGLTVTEAYACGTPVVASDVPGLSDSVQDGVTGLLVRQARPAALAAAITKLLADEEARQHMSCRALAWSAYFDWEESASAVLRAAQRAVLASRSVVRLQAPTGAGRPVTSLPVVAAGPGGSS
jgi:glycosyltransferase involved in cell wall biosynthesis